MDAESVKSVKSVGIKMNSSLQGRLSLEGCTERKR